MDENPSCPPQADTTLAALAVMEQFSLSEYETLDALMDTTNDRELVMGLLDVSQLLAAMVANAAGTSKQDVLDHLRKMVLDLINTGELASGPAPHHQ